MKTHRKHIVLTWLLLFCFAAGQWVVWLHQHSFPRIIVAGHSKSTSHKTVITENCRLCDAMHHAAMAVFSHAYFAPVAVSNYHYKDVQYSFTSIALILSAGRSPPMA